ncbi:hypothetical protein GUITHDRAFT_163756, partial [Guillardia theta CCMP2712]
MPVATRGTGGRTWRGAAGGVAGWTIMASMTLGATGGYADWWLRVVVIPQLKMREASCLVLGSLLQTWPTKDESPVLSQAQIDIYVFPSSAACLAQYRNTSDHCEQFHGKAYMTFEGNPSFASKHKFLQQYAHPGSFFGCFYSEDRERVIFERSFSWVQMMLLALGLTVGMLCLIMAVRQLVVLSKVLTENR